ncbi:MAG TPA: c-type cytochrome [Pyrinomonadaceae bacterium]|nr:c-type cytochrome [Pyrinomonadaceae bacterium]
MKNKIKILAVAVICGVALLSFAGSRQLAQTANPPVETAGQKFKNIKVLNDMPADQMGKVMNMMSASLGVDCKMCHASNDKDFEKDGNEHKDIAREMIKMTFQINKNFFEGKTEVSCNTCHNGKERPVSTPNLNPTEHATRPKQPDVKPTIDQILAKYESALGGKEKLAMIKNRTVNALRLEPDGKTIEPETVTQSGKNFRVETKYGNYVVAEIFDGKSVTKTAGGSAIELKPDEAEQIKREAQLFANADLKAVYAKLDYRFMDKLDGREVYLVLGTLADNSRERLFFDVATGLLVRRIATTPTVLGAFQYQVDYSDHKDFGGVKLPVSTRFAVPAISWTRKILDVKTNVP